MRSAHVPVAEPIFDLEVNQHEKKKKIEVEEEVEGNMVRGNKMFETAKTSIYAGV